MRDARNTRSGVSESVASESGATTRKLLILAGLMLGARGLIGAVNALPDARGEVPKRALQLPARLAGWQGRAVKVDPAVYEVLRPDAVVQKRYTLPRNSQGVAPEVEVLVIYARDPHGLHSPVTCLRAQGWTISGSQAQQMSDKGELLSLQVLSCQQRGARMKLAYAFADAEGAVSGRVATFAKLVAARALRRRVGAYEVQFAYDARSLTRAGKPSPALRALMLSTARHLRRGMQARS